MDIVFLVYQWEISFPFLLSMNGGFAGLNLKSGWSVIRITPNQIVELTPYKVFYIFNLGGYCLKLFMKIGPYTGARGLHGPETRKREMRFSTDRAKKNNTNNISCQSGPTTQR